MANITMTCSPGTYSDARKTREFYDREGNILKLTKAEMEKMVKEDPMSIVPVKVIQQDSIDDSIIEEIARRRNIRA